MGDSHSTLLHSITPEQLRRLSQGDLSMLSEEIRTEIIQTVTQTGGHLASNLGVVELTIALHYVFNTPEDALIWDVGHQCYPHKLLTGRKDQFSQLRSSGGLSGFPKRSESPYDSVDTGHSSTSVSLALGMLAARRGSGNTSKVIAIIGDGSLTGGMAFEALNHGGGYAKDLIVIYNDNQMSISPNVGGFAKRSSERLSRWVSRLSATRRYRSLRDKSHRALVRRGSGLGRAIDWSIGRVKKGLKGLLLRETFFSDLGYEYVGPIDGHSLPQLIHTLEQVREFEKPVVVHVVTTKGKGYAPAEEAPHNYHGVSPASSQGRAQESKGTEVQNTTKQETSSMDSIHQTPRSTEASSPKQTFTQRFSSIIQEYAAKDSSLYAITAAMPGGTGLSSFAETYPNRFFDVGIAEQHALGLSAGLALQGAKPVVALYSSFLQRAVDQVIHDVAIQKLPVVIALDRSGFVGEDGETHQGLFDITLLRGVPGLTILAPADGYEMDCAFSYALQARSKHTGPVVIRYPKGGCPDNLALPSMGKSVDRSEGVRGISSEQRTLTGVTISTELSGRFLRQTPGAKTLIIAVGGVAQEATAAADTLGDRGILSHVYSLFLVQPLDKESLRSMGSLYTHILILEEGMQVGGVAEAIAYTLSQIDNGPAVHIRGVDNQFVPQGSRQEQLEWFGMDAKSLVTTVTTLE